MRYILINFRLILNIIVLNSMLYVCNLIIYFVRNLFYEKLYNNINILLVNININWFHPYILNLIINFGWNYLIKHYIMVSIVLTKISMN